MASVGAGFQVLPQHPEDAVHVRARLVHLLRPRVVRAPSGGTDFTKQKFLGQYFYP
jgi:hypothetical protein